MRRGRAWLESVVWHPAQEAESQREEAYFWFVVHFELHSRRSADISLRQGTGEAGLGVRFLTPPTSSSEFFEQEQSLDLNDQLNDLTIVEDAHVTLSIEHPPPKILAPQDAVGSLRPLSVHIAWELPPVRIVHERLRGRCNLPFPGNNK